MKTLGQLKLELMAGGVHIADADRQHESIRKGLYESNGEITFALAEDFFERQDPSGGMMIFDLVIIRPIGIVATAVGSVFYVISLPFSLLGGNSGEAGKALMKDPADYTFKRPLGEFPQRTL